MQVPKPTAAEKDRFRRLVPDDPRVTIRPMFGNLGAFVDGAMFMGLLGSAVGVKLPDAAREQVLATEGAGPFGPSDRPMGGYVALPAAWVDDPHVAEPWVRGAMEYVRSLPPKPVRKTARKPKPASKPGTTSGP